jgi:hypothetical protein
MVEVPKEFSLAGRVVEVVMLIGPVITRPLLLLEAFS